jgi:hypothetical protein
MEYYSIRQIVLSFVIIWMNLEGFTLSKISKPGSSKKNHMIIFICGISKVGLF